MVVVQHQEPIGLFDAHPIGIVVGSLFWNEFESGAVIS